MLSGVTPIDPKRFGFASVDDVSDLEGDARTWSPDAQEAVRSLAVLCVGGGAAVGGRQRAGGVDVLVEGVGQGCGRCHGVTKRLLWGG